MEAAKPPVESRWNPYLLVSLMMKVTEARELPRTRDIRADKYIDRISRATLADHDPTWSEFSLICP